MNWETVLATASTCAAILSVPRVALWIIGWLDPDRYRLEQVEGRLSVADRHFVVADRLERDGYIRWAAEIRQVGRESIPRLAAANSIHQRDRATYWAGLHVVVAWVWVAIAALVAGNFVDVAAQPGLYIASVFAIMIGFAYLLAAVARWWFVRARFERAVTEMVAAAVRP